MEGFKVDENGVLRIPEGTTRIEGHILQTVNLFNPIDLFSLDDKPAVVRKVLIPASATEIDKLAFSGVESLEEVEFEEGSKLNEVGASAFAGCKKLKRLVFPNGVGRIGINVICGCENLEEVIFPESSTVVIGKTSFKGCGNLRRLHFLGKATKCVDEEEKTNTGSINEQSSFEWDNELIKGVDFKKLEELSIPSGAQSMKTGFYNNKVIKKVRIPGSMEKIKSIAFEDTSLETVEICDGVKCIEDNAFSNCKKLTEIVIPGSVEEIESGAFIRSCITKSKNM